MHEQFHAELIQRFLNELDSNHRLALGNSKIKVCFGSGDQKTVELAEKYPSFLLSPKDVILHVQAESEALFYALSLLLDEFTEAAGRVGFEHFSLCTTPIVGLTFDCKAR
jgi:hypothetical protein